MDKKCSSREMQPAMTSYLMMQLWSLETTAVKMNIPAPDVMSPMMSLICWCDIITAKPQRHYQQCFQGVLNYFASAFHPKLVILNNIFEKELWKALLNLRLSYSFPWIPWLSVNFLKPPSKNVWLTFKRNGFEMYLKISLSGAEMRS